MNKFTLRVTATMPIRVRALNRVDNDGGTFRFITLDDGQEYTLPVRRGELRIGEDPRSGPHFTRVGEVYALLPPTSGRKHKYILGHDRPKAAGNIARLRQYWQTTKEQKPQSRQSLNSNDNGWPASLLVKRHQKNLRLGWRHSVKLWQVSPSPAQSPLAASPVARSRPREAPGSKAEG